MKVKITYTLNNNPDYQLEDLVNWPDLSSVEEVIPHSLVYLDQKYGQGTYTIVSINEVMP